MKKETGGPAFPNMVLIDNPAYYDLRGMTLRDYFAAKAMQGLIAQSYGTAPSSPMSFGAEYAYQMADAMLKERDK